MQDATSTHETHWSRITLATPELWDDEPALSDEDIAALLDDMSADDLFEVDPYTGALYEDSHL